MAARWRRPDLGAEALRVAQEGEFLRSAGAPERLVAVREAAEAADEAADEAEDEAATESGAISANHPK